MSSFAGNEPGGASKDVLIVFTDVFIGIFACTWGPVCWTVIGELYPESIRARGIGLATSSNWLVNFALSFSTPYLVDEKYGNLGGNVFFIWGSTSTLSGLAAYLCVWETKKLSLEEANKMVLEVKPRKSVKYNKDVLARRRVDSETGYKNSTEVAEVEDRSQRVPADKDSTEVAEVEDQNQRSSEEERGQSNDSQRPMVKSAPSTRRNSRLLFCGRPTSTHSV